MGSKLNTLGDSSRQERDNFFADISQSKLDEVKKNLLDFDKTLNETRVEIKKKGKNPQKIKDSLMQKVFDKIDAVYFAKIFAAEFTQQEKTKMAKEILAKGRKIINIIASLPPGHRQNTEKLNFNLLIEYNKEMLRLMHVTDSEGQKVSLYDTLRQEFKLAFLGNQSGAEAMKMDSLKESRAVLEYFKNEVEQLRMREFLVKQQKFLDTVEETKKQIRARFAENPPKKSRLPWRQNEVMREVWENNFSWTEQKEIRSKVVFAARDAIIAFNNLPAKMKTLLLKGEFIHNLRSVGQDSVLGALKFKYHGQELQLSAYLMKFFNQYTKRS